MTANWKATRATLTWLFVAILVLGAVILSPRLVKTSALEANASTGTVVIAKDPVSGKWAALRNGTVDTAYNNIAKNQYGWWYVKEGYVDFSHNGIDKNEYGWWRVEQGKVNFKANEIYKNAYGWWKCTNGKVTFKENGVFKNQFGWWKVENSKVNFKFTGIASNEYGTWYLENGKVDFSKNGEVQYDGKTYTVTKGKATLKENPAPADTTRVDKAVSVMKEMLTEEYFSRELIIETLLEDKDYDFTRAELETAADKTGTNWSEEAYALTVDYTNYYNKENKDGLVGIPREEMQEILEALLFTKDEVSYAIDKFGDANWKEQAYISAVFIMKAVQEDPDTKDEEITVDLLVELLTDEDICGFNKTDATYGAQKALAK